MVVVTIASSAVDNGDLVIEAEIQSSVAFFFISSCPPCLYSAARYSAVVFPPLFISHGSLARMLLVFFSLLEKKN